VSIQKEIHLVGWSVDGSVWHYWPQTQRPVVNPAACSPEICFQ
jgi:hypothetical protein